MDVEPNPGPCDNDCGRFMKLIQENIQRHIVQIIYCVQQQGSSFGIKMDGTLDRFGRALKQLYGVIKELSHDTEQARHDINDLLENRNNTRSRLEALEEEVD